MARILGISAYSHDSSVALVEDGQVTYALQEERLTRKKFDSAFPRQALLRLLLDQGLTLKDFDKIVFFEKPLIKFERIVESILYSYPKGFEFFFSFLRSNPFKNILLKRQILRELHKIDSSFSGKLLFSSHHLSHAASAFYPSPFGRAAILTVDGVGENTCASISLGDGSTIKPLEELHFPHSLGLMYSAFTAYLGFKVNSGEYKVMGLAPYGQPIYADRIRAHFFSLDTEANFSLNTQLFDFELLERMWSSRWEEVLGIPPREPEAELFQSHFDLAASIQLLTNEIMLAFAKRALRLCREQHLVLAGGVALNCVSNSYLSEHLEGVKIWVQPAAGDAGTAVGAALLAYYLDNPRNLGTHFSIYLGPTYTQEEIEENLSICGLKFDVYEESELLNQVVQELESQSVVGWFQGRLEFGPRALGSRSILADPRNREMQSNLNLKTKFRESFRPFAPSVLEDACERLFEDRVPNDSYMMFVRRFNSNIKIDSARDWSLSDGPALDRIRNVNSIYPAVTHLDGSARAQILKNSDSSRYSSLLRKFYERTAVPLLVNTSFNVRGEPIVASPEDAIRCFLSSGIDVLVIGNCIVRKMCQDPKVLEKFKMRSFLLD